MKVSRAATKAAGKAVSPLARVRMKFYGVVLVIGTAVMVVGLALLSFIGVEDAKTAPSQLALDDIPPAALEAYLSAGDHCEGLSWNVLAGIGKVESNHGRVFGGSFSSTGDVVPPIFGAALNGTGAGGNTTPWSSGEWEGQWGLEGPWLRALGPMQFISPSWAAFGQDGNGDGVENPHNIFDGALAAGQLLCQSEGGEIEDIYSALWSYNRSREYADLVMHWARLYVALPFGLGDGTAEDLLNHPNIELAPRARGDVEAGIVDPRLIASLVSAADQFTMYIGWFKTGHSECVGGGSIAQRPGCTVSNHYYGRAADIGAVGFAGEDDRPLVRPNNEAARVLTDLWGSLPGDDVLRPESLGSPWDTGVFAGHFTDAAHQNHLHVAWRSEPPPPSSINSTRHGIEEPDRSFVIPSSSWFPSVALPARENQVSATPSTAQSVIDAAGPSTQIVLGPGTYRYLRVSGKSGVSIVGTDGVSLVTSGDVQRAGVTVVNSSDVTVSGLYVADSFMGISVWGSTNVLVAGNFVTRIQQEGIHIGDDSSFVTVQNNSISRTGLRTGVDPEQGLPYKTFGEGIYVGTGRPSGVDKTNNVSIIGNLISDTGSEAIDVKNGTSSVVIRRNVISNVATQTSGAVVVDLGTFAPASSVRTEVIGNVIYNTSRTSRWRDGNAVVASGPVLVQANVIWGSEHLAVWVKETPGPVMVTRNVMFDNGLGDVNTDGGVRLFSETDNLGGEVLSWSEFEGGWIDEDGRPSVELARFVAALENALIPIGEIRGELSPSAPVGVAVDGSYTVAQVIDGTIGAGDGSNPNEEAPMGRHEASLFLPQGWNWAQGPTRNAQWGQLGSGGSQYAEWRCAVIPENGHTPPVPFRVNVRAGAYYQFVAGSWSKAFDVDLTGGNHGGYLGNAGVLNADPFSSGGHGQIQWRRESDGSFSAPWDSSALFMHFWAGRRQAPAAGQTAEFLTSEMRLQQPDGQTVDLSGVRVLFQCGVDYYAVTSGQGTKVPGPGIAKYNRLTEQWRPGLWVTLPAGVAANSAADFEAWLSMNLPPNVSSAATA